MQLGLDEGADGLGRVGRRVVLKAGQLVGEGGADEVGASAEDLAELDEGGAHLGQGHANAHVGGQAGDGLAVEAGEEAAYRTDVDGLEPVGEAVLEKDGHDLGQSAGGALMPGEGREVHKDVDSEVAISGGYSFALPAS